MAGLKFDGNIELNENQITGFILERFSNLTLPISTLEGRVGYHDIKKLPTYYNGYKFEFLVTEDYVNKTLGGLSWKDEVRVAADTNKDTEALQAGIAIDGITLADEDRVLLFGQTDKTENGVWVISAVPYRPFDMDDSVDFNSAVVPVRSGTVYAKTQFRCSTIDPDVGSDDIEFKDFTPVVPDATEVVKGKMRLASHVEVMDGNEGEAAVTPLTLSTVLDPIRLILESVVPPAPLGLSGKTLSMSVYVAKLSGDGANHNCTDSTKPEGEVDGFYDGDRGTLQALVDENEDGSVDLTTGSDVGTYDSLVVLDDSDPIPVGQIGRGLYKKLDAMVKSASALALGRHTYQMTHSITGDSAELVFWVDDPGDATVVINDYSLTPLTEFISGVPSMAAGDVVSVGFIVSNAVRKHYNGTRLARVYGPQLDPVNVAPPVVAPIEGADVTYSTLVEAEVLENVYTENLEILVEAFNSKGVAGVPASFASSSRVDTVSDESNRETAGSGLYPSSGYNGNYDSTYSLRQFYTEELQLVNGRYRRPSGDYTFVEPTQGPDYSTGMGSAVRWVLFNTGVSLSDASGFTLEFSDVLGTWNGVETSGIKIQVKVEGVTGWLDANKAFPLVGSPQADGSPCLVFADSTEFVRKVSFGSTTRSGLLLIRVGLDEWSNKEIGQNIDIYDIY